MQCNEIAVHFVSTKKISKLHVDFFDDPTTTDCISFPYDDEEEEDRFLGEIFVCPQTAIDYVEKNGGDVYEEVMLYVVHGILHLLGFDDIKEKDRKKMKKEELRTMQYLMSQQIVIHS